MKSLLLAIALVLASGCATTQFFTEVDSLARPELVGNTYTLLPGNEGVDVDGLEFAAYKAQTIRALAEIGYVEAPIEDADFAIFVGYGIGAPQTRSYSVPLFGQTGSTTTGASTYGTINTIGNTSTINTTTTVNSTPTYGIVGSANKSETVFSRHLVMTAYDLSVGSDGEYDEVWRTTVTSTGSSGDLRRVFPILLASGVSHFGSATDQQKKYRFTETNPVVLKIKGQSTQ